MQKHITLVLTLHRSQTQDDFINDDCRSLRYIVFWYGIDKCSMGHSLQLPKNIEGYDQKSWRDDAPSETFYSES
jgi:hypothetical protein